MDEQLLNEETQKEPERKTRRQKEAGNPRKFIPIPEFLKHFGDDVRWFYDIRLWSPLILLLLFLALVPGKKDAEPVETTPEVITTDIQPEKETEVVVEPIDPEAEALAKLADSVGVNRSENVRTIIMWVAVNRSEDRSNGYGQSLLDEIARPNQWQGYDEEIAYSEYTYSLAKNVLETVRNDGLRPLDSDMLWFVLNDNGSITVRNQFTGSGNQKWREKTIK